MLYGRLARKAKIPDKSWICNRSLLSQDRDDGRRAYSFSLDVETMYSARAGCGFHCTSATSHVPPWGRKRGTSDGALRSMMKRPLRLQIRKRSD